MFYYISWIGNMDGRHPSGGSTSAQLSKGYLTLPAKKKDILLVSKVYRDMLPRYGQDPELCELFILHLWPPWEKKRKIYQFKVYRSVPLIIWSFLIKLLGHVLSCIIVHGIP